MKLFLTKKRYALLVLLFIAAVVIVFVYRGKYAGKQAPKRATLVYTFSYEGESKI